MRTIKKYWKVIKNYILDFLKDYKLITYDPLQTTVNVGLLSSTLLLFTIIVYSLFFISFSNPYKIIIIIEAIIALILIGIVTIVSKLYFEIKSEQRYYESNKSRFRT